MTSPNNNPEKFNSTYKYTPSSSTAGKPEVNHALIEAVRLKKYRQISLLVESGVEVDETDERGNTALITCCTHLNDSQIRSKFLHLLLRVGANPNSQNKLGMSALMHASALGQTEAAQILLHHPTCDLEVQDLEGNTALMYAAAFGHEDVVSLILNQMGRLRRVLHLSQRNYRGLTAAQMAAQNGHQRVVWALDGSRPLFAKFDKQNFPDPTQLDRSSTPTSPLPTMELSQNWVKRLTDRRLRLSNSDDDDEDSWAKKDETRDWQQQEESNESITTTASHRVLECGLPPLWLNDNTLSSKPLHYNESREQELNGNKGGSRRRTSTTMDGIPFLPPTNDGHINRQLSCSKLKETLNLKKHSKLLDRQVRNDNRVTDNDPLIVHGHHQKRDRGCHLPPIRPFLATLLPHISVPADPLQNTRDSKVFHRDILQLEQTRDDD